MVSAQKPHGPHPHTIAPVQSHLTMSITVADSRAGDGVAPSPRPSHPVPTIGDMAKTAKRHRCIDCGSTTARWAGRCPTCGEWNTLVEEAHLGSLVQAVDELGLSAMPVQLSTVDVSEAAAVPTGLEEFDRVLSGGLVPGSVTLLGGEPGIGKSTLLLQVLAARAAAGHRVLLDLRRGVGPPGPTAGRTSWSDPARTAHPAGHRCRCGHRCRHRVPARSGGGRFDPGRVDRPVPARRAAHHRGAGERDPGAGVRRPARGPGQVPTGGHGAGRPCDQGRFAGRSPRPRAHGRHRAQLRGRPTPRPPAPPGGEAPVRADRRAGALRDGRPGAQSGRPIRAASSSATAWSACPAVWCFRPCRAAGPCWWSSRPWSPPWARPSPEGRR